MPCRRRPTKPPTFFPFSFLFISGPRPRSSFLLSPAYNNPLISPLLGRDVGSGKSPVTMLRWCRQPSPSKATLALFPFCLRSRIVRSGRHHVHLKSGRADRLVWPAFTLREVLTTVGAYSCWGGGVDLATGQRGSAGPCS